MRILMMQLTKEDVPNLHAVLDQKGKTDAPWLFRGGQPTPDGFDNLKSSYGIRTVICLRRDDTQWEQQYVGRLGLNFVCMPLPLKLHELSRAQFAQQVKKFLQAITDGPRNVFVHGHEGIDRTGLMIAFYRICKQAWTLDEAFLEMEEKGYHGFAHQVILSKFKDRLFDVERIKMELDNS
jgi:protein tyrosine/serine phosphatase